MTSSMLRRQLKNLVQNFSEAEVKVTELFTQSTLLRTFSLSSPLPLSHSSPSFPLVSHLILADTNSPYFVQVREATSNDPWGPSGSQMADISDLTYNVVACNEIMTMLWKRLNDDKNWRHVHKVT